MKNEQILTQLATIKKGTYISLTKTKDLGNGITKESDMLIRLGCNYANLKINKNKETGKLPWGHWVEGLENLVVEHKGNYYLRITSRTPENPESGADVIATRYLLNGREISKDEATKLVEPKNFESKASSVYNIKFENIKKLGGRN